MKMQNIFSKLVDKANQETPPAIDVVDQVMTRLSAGQVYSTASSDKPFVWIASLSTAAAIMTATLAVYAYYAWANPLIEISDTIAWVL